MTTLHAPGNPVALDAWYPVGSPIDIRRSGIRRTRLLGRTIDLTVHRTWISPSLDGQPLPVTERLGLVWTTLGRPNESPPSIIEYYEVDRDTLNMSSEPIEATGPEIVEIISRVLKGKQGALWDQSLPDHAPIGLSDDGGGHSVARGDWAGLGITGAACACRVQVLGPYSAIALFPKAAGMPGQVPREDFYGVFCQPQDDETVVIHYVVGFVDTPSLAVRAMSEGFRLLA